jgi:hypothetical protein
MKPYRPSGRIPLAGYFAMSVAAIVGGAAIGGLTHLISQLFYLVILFPIGMGLGGLMVMAIAITSGKVRNPWVAGIFGLLTGFSIYGAMNYAKYTQFQDSMRSEIKQDVSLKDANPDLVISEFLKSETNSDGVVGFIKYRAKQGVSIGKIGRNGGNIGEVGTWIYWSIELLIIQLIIVLGSIGIAKNPFCESSNEWYKDEEKIGSVPADAASNFLELVNGSRFAEAGALIEDITEIPTVDSLVVSKQVSPKDPNADVFLKVGKIKIDEKGNVETNEAISGVISAIEYQVFHRSGT